MSWQAAAFGTTVTAMFVYSLFRMNMTTVVASVLFIGWVSGQVAQGISGTFTPTSVYIAADFISAAFLFTLLAHQFRWWVWCVASIYGLMLMGHSFLFWGIVTPYEHWLYLTALFSLQILIAGGRMYAERTSFSRDRRRWLRGKSIGLGHSSRKEKT